MAGQGTFSTDAHTHTDSNQTLENWRGNKQTGTICSKPSWWRLSVSNKGPPPSWLWIMWKLSAEGEKKKPLRFATVSWGTGKILIRAAVHQARLPLAPQVCLLKWAQQDNFFLLCDKKRCCFCIHWLLSCDQWKQDENRDLNYVVKRDDIKRTTGDVFIFFYWSLVWTLVQNTAHNKNIQYVKALSFSF